MGSLLHYKYWQSSMWSTVFLHLANENIQGRGWIKHSSLKSTLIVWKASMIPMSDPLPSHSVLNGFFFFFLFSFWWVALPSTTTLGLWKIPAQWLFCLLLNVVLRLKITIHNNAKNGEGEQKKWRVCSQSPGFGGQHLKELGTMDPLASTTLTINIRTQEEHPNQVLLHTS